ncbi:hypothetical protein Sjap_023000 [Stephania japonica]|uniref:aminodeoxychorismate synthase n=1 Tax=Stephania japonica TaxID=461633 RepID=A0AAP0EVL6_9MAGN
MDVGLVLLSLETMCPRVKYLIPKSGKPLLSSSFVRFGGFSKQKHIQALNQDDVSSGVYQSLVNGHEQEGLGVRKKARKVDISTDFRCVKTLLIDNYDSYTYNIYQELSVINGVPPVVVRNDELTWEQIQYLLYEDQAFDNIVISPGPGSPTCPADIGICLQVLLGCKDIPILGVCLGHQALGYVHGAKIVHAPKPVHGRLSEVEHTGCDLFLDIPSGTNSGFNVVRYHSLAIDEDSLPDEVIPIAWSCTADALSSIENKKYGIADEVLGHQYEKNKAHADVEQRYSSNILERADSTKVIMGIMHATQPHYGVQFHPESVATNYGRKIFQNFKKITVDYWLRSPHLCKRMLQSAGTASHEIVHPTFLKLKWKKYDCLADQVGGAKDVFCKLFGEQKAENTFWLDNSSTEKGRARFSYMGGKGGSLWKQITFKLSYQRDSPTGEQGHLTIEDAQGHETKTYLEDGFLNFMDKELRSFRYDEEDFKGLPFDFYGGYVGYIGYELKAECCTVSNRHQSRTPDACFFFADNLVAIDHLYDVLYVLSIHEIHHPQTASCSQERSTARSWIDDIEQKLLSLRDSTSKTSDEKMPRLTSAACEVGFHIEKSKDQYMGDVEKCLEFIKDGESYELCLTTQMRKRLAVTDYLGLYLKLREVNPAPYAAWLNFSKEDLCICSSSPERFLQLDGTGKLEAKPIKGTIARGSTHEEDDRLKRLLQYSEKDQAENLMIVDLLRNDLGRVCEPGSVHVPRLMEVESYATVHTLVSTIQGKKRSDLSAVDCIKAAFPGGSMTGAPKLRSMELLDSLESSSRGIYSGSIGFFSYNQTFDLNIVIRTIVIHEGEASIGAGGAVIALSIPEQEYEEMILKTKAPVRTINEYEKESMTST